MGRQDSSFEGVQDGTRQLYGAIQVGKRPKIGGVGRVSESKQAKVQGEARAWLFGCLRVGSSSRLG